MAASRTAKGVDKSERVRGSLKALAQGAQPPTHEADNCQPGETWHGWQHEASRVERHFRSHQILLGTQALWLSPISSAAETLTCSWWSCCAVSVFPSSPCVIDVVAVLPTRPSSSCVRGIWVLGRLEFAIESGGTRSCRKGGANAATNVVLRTSQGRLQEEGGEWRSSPTVSLCSKVCISP